MPILHGLLCGFIQHAVFFASVAHDEWDCGLGGSNVHL